MSDEAPSALIDAKIAGLADWRGEALARIRKLIREADPEVVETVKWRKPSNPAGVPVWEHAGILCTGEVYKGYVKLTFPRGAFLTDFAELFNRGLETGVRRSINLGEGDEINESAFKALIREAVEVNVQKTSKGLSVPPPQGEGDHAKHGGGAPSD